MNDETLFRDKLRKIEAPFAGAGDAAEWIRGRLRQEEKREKPVEIRFSLPGPWSRQMFIAMCRRYGLRPYRYPRMRRQSVAVRPEVMAVDRLELSEAAAPSRSSRLSSRPRYTMCAMRCAASKPRCHQCGLH